MTTAQRNQHRELYNQLRLALVYPGETIAGYTRPYAPVNYAKWDMTWDELMACPDDDRIARLRARYPLAGLLRAVA